MFHCVHFCFSCFQHRDNSFLCPFDGHTYFCVLKIIFDSIVSNNKNLVEWIVDLVMWKTNTEGTKKNPYHPYFERENEWKKVGSISCAQELVWQLETKTIFDIKFVNTISFQSCINIYTHVWKMHDANAQASMDALHRHPALESLGKWSHAHIHTHTISVQSRRGHVRLSILSRLMCKIVLLTLHGQFAFVQTKLPFVPTRFFSLFSHLSAQHLTKTETNNNNNTNRKKRICSWYFIVCLILLLLSMFVHWFVCDKAQTIIMESRVPDY